MSYNSTQLITGAYYSSGVVSREFETVSGSQIADGLQWLNEILAEKNVNQSMLPYESTFFFSFTTGVERYFIPNLSQIDTLVFYLDSVRYAMSYEKRNQYFGSSRVENIQTLPNCWYFEKQAGGGNLYIYFKPDKYYPIEIHGSFSLNSVTLQQELSNDVCIFDLGIPTIYSSFTLAPGQLVVDGYDLSGTYTDLGYFLNYINSGIIPDVRVRINVNDIVFYSISTPPSIITIQTEGYLPNGTRSKGSVAAATTSNLTATYINGTSGVGATLVATAPGALVVDGYTVQIGDRILVKNQDIPSQNGSYSLTTLGTGVTNWVLTRTTNYDETKDIQVGDLFFVINGNDNKGLTFVQTSTVSIIGIPPSSITFILFQSVTFSNFSTIGFPQLQVSTPSGYDQYYLTYLRYALADRICTEYNFVVPVSVSKQLAEYESIINKKSKLIDLRNEKSSTLQKRASINYAFVNLGKGWSVPSP